MNGIVLLDEAQHRALTQATRELRARSHEEQQQHARQQRSSSSASAQRARVDFTTNKRSSVEYHSGGCPVIREPQHTASLSLDGDAFGPACLPYRASEDDGDAGDDAARDNAGRYAGASSGRKVSVTYTMVGIAAGAVLGLVLSHLQCSPVAARWVALPGDLFLRALKCLVIPYIFCAVAVAIGDIVFVGKVSVVGMQTLRVFVVFWLASTVVGFGVSLLFRPLFRDQRGVRGDVPINAFSLRCANDRLLRLEPNGTVACAASSTTHASVADGTAFVVRDLLNAYRKTSASGIAQFSVSEELKGKILNIVSANLFASMAHAELLSTITFSMVLGTIAGRSYFTRSRRVNYLYLTMLQLRNTLFLAMEWVIWLSPGAVISMVAGSLASNQDSWQQLSRGYAYVVASGTVAITLLFVVHPLLVFLLTRTNPYNHMRKMLRAYLFAFACSSSLLTAPVTLTCIRKARVCSQSLANFVISIGVCSNLSGMGFYVPIAITFLAESSGHGDQLTAPRLLAIFFLSLASCAGTLPIPAGGLVVISAVYTSVFGVRDVPPTFVYVLAMEFLADRFATVCNVSDDIMAVKIIAENTDETVVQEELGERS
ncbi:hypothetical protein PINS_up006442 [Pythium insidiosum]|nr:hypothetical protein PINS_up006442 [Pythium insidiosum]